MNPAQSRKTRLLAINFGGIGDELLFLPTLKSIRDEHPDWHITLLLEPRSQSVAQVTNLIDATIAFDIKKKPLHSSDLMVLLGLVRNGDFDLVVSSGSSTAVSILLFLSGIRVRVGYDSGRLSRLLLTNPVGLNRSQYAALMYHDLVRGLGIERSPELPAVALPASAVESARGLLAPEPGTASGAHGGRRVLIHPGMSRLALAKGIMKTWSADNWAELIARLSAQPDIVPVLAGGPDDRETIAEIEARTKGTRLISTAGRTKGLSDLAGLISLCDLMICVDSAPMHLSVALGKPLVALFGPTDEKKLLPADPRFKALRGRPLLEESHQDSAPTSQGVEIPPDAVFQSALEQLARS